MASDQTQRRLRRRDAQRLFDELAADYLDLPDVSRAVMFGSDGLRVNAKFFALVGGEGELIVKLPAAQCARLSWQPAKLSRYGPDAARCVSGSAYLMSLTAPTVPSGEN